MHLNKLIEHFDNYEKLHVEVNAVRDQLIGLGVQDEIRFHFVDIDSNILRGLIYRYSRHDVPYGEPICCSEICIAKNLSSEWRRVVAVKELIHITDTPQETAQSELAVEKLIERLALPFDVREETSSSMNDKIHILPALAILVPLECRTILRKLVADNHITLIDVAKIAQIPLRYSEVVMSDQFDGFVEEICKVRK